MKIALYGDKTGTSEIISKYPAEYENSVNDFLHFLRCAINEYPFGNSYSFESTDIRKLVALSEYYGVTPAFYNMLDILMLNSENEFLDAGLRANFFYERFQKDFKHIAEFFDKNKIWYVPLENTLLLEYRNYHNIYINDNAFLIALEGMALMERLVQLPNEEVHLQEYKIIPSETTEHCVSCYTYKNMKCRFYTTLFENEPEFRIYCENMLSRLKTGSPEKFEWYLNVKNCTSMKYFDYNDMYIYLTIRNYIAYRDWKASLSSLVETYSIHYQEMETLKNLIDFEYVERELRKLNIAEFEKVHRSLAWKLLSVEPQELLTGQESEMLEHYLYPADFNADKLIRLEKRCDSQTVYGSFFDFPEPEEYENEPEKDKYRSVLALYDPDSNSLGRLEKMLNQVLPAYEYKSFTSLDDCINCVLNGDIDIVFLDVDSCMPLNRIQKIVAQFREKGF